MSHPDRPDRARMRASDRDRDEVSELLREACGEGRLTVAELEERLEKAYAARTQDELDVLVMDLPGGTLLSPLGSRSLVPADAPLTIAAGMNNEKRTGRWTVPPHLIVRAHLGNVKLDFTSALVPNPRIRLDVRADVGHVLLVVPRGWLVDTDSVKRGLGPVKNRVEAPHRPDVAILVTGSTPVGTLIARHPRPERWRWLTGS